MKLVFRAIPLLAAVAQLASAADASSSDLILQFASIHHRNLKGSDNVTAQIADKYEALRAVIAAYQKGASSMTPEQLEELDLEFQSVVGMSISDFLEENANVSAMSEEDQDLLDFLRTEYNAPLSVPTGGPTSGPTMNDDTFAPTGSPTSSAPTSSPTSSAPTGSPTSGPTTGPSFSQGPTVSPTSGPTLAPTTSKAPTMTPTSGPTSGPTITPALTFVGDREMAYYELAECEGDCDYDSDCDFGLVCGFRSGSSSKPASVAGCVGNATEIDNGNHDFCIQPPTSNTLVIVADYEDSDRNDWPLGMCEADCYGDDDCEGDLQCWLPFEPGETVPGCVGTGELDYGYCYSTNPLLDFVGNYEMGYYELAECQGDCDYDSDCDFGLVCGLRSLGETNVSGCLGDASKIGDGTHDFCIKPPTANTLVILTDYEESDTSEWPLAACQADCFNDEDCEGELECWVDFEEGDILPGCIGMGEEAYGYCYNTTKEIEFVGDREMGYYELEECQGDCDYDSDCGLGLVCGFRLGNETDVPGCSGDATQVDSGSHDYCIKPPTPETLVIVADYDESGKSEYPLGKCKADCYNDDDCESDLACWIFAEGEIIPGCDGAGEDGYGYCYNASLTLEFIANRPMEYYELDECEGDCDYDSDCDLGLVCGFRDFNDTFVPGCGGNATEIGDGTHDFCIKPLTANTLVIVADYEESDTEEWPLGECQADCYNDDDCEEDLECWVPFDEDEGIPGCIGTGEEEYGYCYNPLLR